MSVGPSIVAALLLTTVPGASTAAPTFVSTWSRPFQTRTPSATTTFRSRNEARILPTKVSSPSSSLAASFFSPSTVLTSTTTAPPDVTFVPPNVSDIQDEDCQNAARRMQRVMVPVSTDISSTGSIGISYIHWPAAATAKQPKLPLLLVHGFDSSCLEYRRLGPKLAALGVDTYAVDLLGWGFTQLLLDEDTDETIQFSAQAKVGALAAFWKAVGKEKPVCIAGASLGGAAAIEYAAAASSNSVQALVLLDAQGFVDGIGPMAQLPRPLARLGVSVLQSVPLRSSANQMSYFDPSTFATPDALQIGRLHCLQNGWNDALLDFMASGGFQPSTKIAACQSLETLILWGRQDAILDGSELVPKFQKELPNAQVQWIEECGHVPHLEKPEETAKAIATFLESLVEKSQDSSSSTVGTFAVGTAAAVAVTAAAVVANGPSF